jgi:hypothetical protein
MSVALPRLRVRVPDKIQARRHDRSGDDDEKRSRKK